MALDPSIILAGQSPDIIGNFSRGIQTGQQMRQAQTQNRLSDLYQTQGAQIAAGDQNALNALASISPDMALNVQNTRLGMDQTRQSMQIQAEQAKRAAADYAKGLSAEQRAAEAAQLEQGLKGAEFFYQKGDKAGYQRFLQEQGIDPAQFPFEAFPAAAASAGVFLEALKAPEPYKPQSPEGKFEADKAAGILPSGAQFEKPADDYQRYVQEETAAGRTPLSRLDFEQAKKGKGFTTTVTNPDGTTTTISMGGGADKPQTVGDVYTPGTPDQAVELIDDILANPSLARITGPIEGGGGNNIDEMSAIRRAWYGERGLDAIDKTNQLQSQAWMAARAMLKGGGQITDYESRKAEAAVARLSRAKGETEFRAALTDLRDAIVEGRRKLEAAKGGASAPADAGSGSQVQGLSPEAQSVFEKYRSR